jgi:hypothetical protein
LGCDFLSINGRRLVMIDGFMLKETFSSLSCIKDFF